jgi:MFS family permease
MIFFNGVARAFYGPATFVIYTQSVPKEIYTNAATWSSSTWQIASILGPAAGGLIYGYLGISVTFAVILVFLADIVGAWFTCSDPIRPYLCRRKASGKAFQRG